uniref:Aspartic peptidase DDI1-type domain-containing protein n=1 Tax=Oryzias latipes TaxID=8090 RepID=A0A3P9IA68_ORYLA
MLEPAGMQMENRWSSEALDAAALRQQRRLKQAIRFLHRDSADLLPLDGLKKLGTSKQGQPHNIVQKRLLQACESMAPKSGRMLLSPLNSREDKREDEDFVHVLCKCLGQEVKVLIDTGCKLNLMSSRTVEILGLTALVEKNQTELNGFPFPHNVCVQGCIQELSLTIGQLRIMSSFLVLESTEPLLSLGLKTLRSLKCVIDTEKQMLVFGTAIRERVQFAKKPFIKSSSDF